MNTTTSHPVYPLNVLSHSGHSGHSRAKIKSASVHDEDMELIRRVVNQDQMAFATLYARYTPRVRRYLSCRLRSAELIDEVLQDVMLVLWQQATRIPSPVPLVAWLCGIARNQALKALARQASVDLTSQESPELIDPHEPESVLLHQEDQQLFIQMLDNLPYAERIALNLHLLQGQSYQKIALATGDPESTIRTRVSRACQRLQDNRNRQHE